MVAVVAMVLDGEEGAVANLLLHTQPTFTRVETAGLSIFLVFSLTFFALYALCSLLHLLTLLICPRLLSPCI